MLCLIRKLFSSEKNETIKWENSLHSGISFNMDKYIFWIYCCCFFISYHSVSLSLNIYIYIYIVMAIDHGRVIMQESKDYYENWKWGRRSAGLRALATVKDKLRKGKGLDPDKEKTCHWSSQGGRFTAKKNVTQKVSSKLQQGIERSPFHVVRWKGKF